MSAPLQLLQKIQSAPATDTWKAIFDYAWTLCSQTLSADSAVTDVNQRDQKLAALDLFLSSAGWDLWRDFETSTEKTADALATWWAQQQGGRAVLILDALSLREVPWILQGALERGFKIESTKVTGAELPADTTSFAKALGFGQRSALENNGAGQSHRLSGARTDSVNLPWVDCASLIGAESDWVLWHHWPDSRVHDLSGSGKGLSSLVTEAVAQLTSPDFWSLIDRLTTGRSLVITSDHGYAASGLFSDTSLEQAKYLKSIFKSGRWHEATNDVGPWVPPVDITLDSRHGKNRFVLGRRKWKSQAGYPTLIHGGLSILEVASPFIEISRR